MRHTFFALFDDAGSAEGALADLRADARLQDRVSVIVHRDKLRSNEVDFSESDSRRGALIGVALGGAGGALFSGLALGPLGLFGAGPLFSALAGLTAGSVFGLLTGVFAGTARPVHRLKELAAHLEQGKVLITVQAEGMTCEEEVEDLFRRHGAIEARRGLV